MKANPGGQISTREVIGRDKLIAKLWRTLERQSLILSAERRMGKTSVIKKMVAEATKDKLVVYRDLEAIRTPLEFVETVLRDVQDNLSLIQKAVVKRDSLLSRLGGVEIGGFIKLPPSVAPNWKDLLATIIKDLIEESEPECQIIFFWDEMPLMLHNIKQHEGEAVAMEMLDVLRSLRNMYPSLRMVFTGSIGLHNVLSALKKAGHANDATNDMDLVEVNPLEQVDAIYLAKLLILGDPRINIKNEQAILEAIAEGVEGFAFYIHHVVDELGDRNEPIDADLVKSIIQSALIDSQDRWHLRYYNERISIYYDQTERPFALGLLDALAVAAAPLTFDELFNLHKSRAPTEDRELALTVLTLLRRDHYVTQLADGKYQFRFKLIQQAWRFHRGGI